MANGITIGSSGNDTFTGRADDEIFLGMEGDDWIFGLGGNDELYGEQGNDSLDGGVGNDTLNGGTGIDVAWYTYVTAAVNVNLATGRATGGGGSDTLIDIEDVVAGGYNDVLVGNDGSNHLEGGAGNDSITGGAGNDILYGDAGNDSVSGGAGIDSLVGGAGKDTLDGGADFDVLMLNGLPSDYTVTRINATDVRFTRGADDMLVRNVETVVVFNGPTYTEVLMSNAAPVLNRTAAADSITGSLAFSNVIDGLGGNDTITGGGGHDSLLGGAGNDSLIGAGGNDSLVGGAGTDTMIGGAGDDAYEVDLLADVVQEAAGEGTDLVNVKLTSGSYTLGADVENGTVTATGAVGLIGNALTNVLTGGAGANTLDGKDGNDTLIGGAGNDSLIGGLGDDSMTGGAGNDTYEVDSLADVVVEATNGGTDSVNVNIGTNNANYTLGANVENAKVTSTASIDLTGNDLANTLTGNAAVNWLIGGKGVDRLIGGAGDDSYFVDVAGDVIVEAATANELDTVYVDFAVKGTYTLAANVEDGVIISAPAVLVNLTGNAGNNRLDGSEGTNVVMGGVGNDTLWGGMYDAVAGPAKDTLDGGAGTDVAFFSGSREDYVVARPTGTDVRLTNQWTGEVTTVRNVEFFRFDDPAGDIDRDTLIANAATTGNNDLTGTDEFGDLIDGLAGNDTIKGLAGDDTLFGGAGNDSLIGGLDSDEMDGGAGNDTYEVDSLGDVVVEGVNAGTDLINVSIESQGDEYWLPTNVENAALTSTGDVTLAGNAGNNALTGNELVNLLYGEAGNDTLTGGGGGDVLSGGSGNDRMLGGDGDDFYFVDAVGDVIVEIAGEGDDDKVSVLLTSGTYVLAANVERAYIDSNGAVSLTGNASNNWLVGNDAANKIVGGAGDDTIFSLLGNDTLTGGAGFDEFRFDTAASSTNVDTITDFKSGEDLITLDTWVFTALGDPDTEGDLSGPYLNYNSTTGALTYDADGTGAGAAVTIAILGAAGARPALTNADIWLI